MFWPKLRVILKHKHFHSSKPRGDWKPDLLLKSVEDYHAGFKSIHCWSHDLLKENRYIIDKINPRLGYRLQPVEITCPATVRIATPQDAFTKCDDDTKQGDLIQQFSVVVEQ